MANATPVHGGNNKKPLSKEAQKVKEELNSGGKSVSEPVDPNTTVLPDGTVRVDN